MKPFVSVVVPTCDREELLKSCLFSLFQQTYPKDRYEVIVADGSTADKTKKLIDSLVISSPTTSYVRTGYKEGPSHSRNIGVHEAKGEIILFTDDDCIANQNWINETIKVYEEYPDIDGVGGRVFSDPAQPKNFVIRYMEALKIIPDTELIVGQMETPFLATCNMSYKKNIFEELGGFNEALRVGEDYDLIKRFRERGYKLVYVPTAIVYHHQRENIIPYLKHDCFERGKGYFTYLYYKKGYPLSFILIIGAFLLIITVLFNLPYLPLLLLSYFIGALSFAYYRGSLRNLRRASARYFLIFLSFFIFIELPLKIVGYIHEGISTAMGRS